MISRKMSIITLLTLAVLAFGATASATGTYCPKWKCGFNGLTPNGLTFNGKDLNGWQLNGFRMNGARLNSLTFNGRMFNSLSSQTLLDFAALANRPLGINVKK